MSRSDQEHQIARILEKCRARLLSGHDCPVEAIVAKFPHLMPELGDGLERLREELSAAAAQQECSDPRADGDALEPDDQSLATQVISPQTPSTDPEAVAETSVSSLDDSRIGPAEEPSSAEAAANSSAPGSVSPDRFEVIKELGAGAFGTVYHVRDTQLDREVALKIPKLGVLASEADAQRFLREARAAGNLRHPHIVPIYDAGKLEDSYFIASGYIEGQTLEEVIAGAESLSRREIAELVQKLAGALHFAHTKGIIHRDVKPANVMIDTDGEPLVMDFGMARRDEADVLKTQEGMHIEPLTAIGPNSTSVAVFSDTAPEVFHVADDRLRGHEAGVEWISYNSCGRIVATAGADKTVRVWDCTTGTCLKTIEQEGPVVSVAFSPDNHLLAAGGREIPVTVWEVKSGDRANIVPSSAGEVPPSATEPDSPADFRILQRLDHRDVQAIAWHPHKTTLATAGRDNHVKLWQPATGELLADLAGHEACINAAAFSSCGNYLATTDDRKTLRIWTLDRNGDWSSKPVEAHKDRVLAVAWHPARPRLATAGTDANVCLWKAETNERDATLVLPGKQEYLAVAISPDGRRLATGTSDGRLTVWDADLRLELVTLKIHGGAINCVAWSPDGQRIMTASSDGTLWHSRRGDTGLGVAP